MPVTDGVLNVSVLDRGTGNPPENAALKAIAILQMPSADGMAAPRILSIRRVELNLQITVIGQPNLPSILAGLTSMTLEESPDLAHWSELLVPPVVSNGQLNFEVPPVSGIRFYRVSVHRMEP